jgi:ketosteroid isomerase-like protein
MTEDCVFEASAGPDVNGEKFTGQEQVSKAFENVFATFPDARWSNPKHLISADRGFTEWVFSGTRTDGTNVEVTGCDLFTFRNGKIAIKNSYRKNRLR